MVSHRRFPFLLIPSLIVGGFTALHVTEMRHTPPAPPSLPFSRLSDEQIYARTKTLCALFANQEEEVRLSVSKYEIKTSLARRYWVVDCTDTAGNYLGFFSWDAQSGELYMVWHRSDLLSARRLPPINRQDAVEMSRRWMNNLGIAQRAPQWRLASTPKRMQEFWHVVWEAKERKATLWINQRSGDLFLLKSG